MTNKDRQKNLDKQIWLESEKEHIDKSGVMYYCSACNYRKEYTCLATQQNREDMSLCAKAYNKSTRRKK